MMFTRRVQELTDYTDNIIRSCDIYFNFLEPLLPSYICENTSNVFLELKKRMLFFQPETLVAQKYNRRPRSLILRMLSRYCLTLTISQTLLLVSAMSMQLKRIVVIPFSFMTPLSGLMCFEYQTSFFTNNLSNQPRAHCLDSYIVCLN